VHQNPYSLEGIRYDFVSLERVAGSGDA
jgi:hypothetical protein